jgi:hypothetical protein
MKYRIEYHRGAKSIVNEPNLSEDYAEILSSISEIDEHQILEFFLNQKKEERELGKKNYKKSVSDALNHHLRLNLLSKGWQKEAKIFKSADY